MTNVEIIYNPYRLKTEISINNVEIKEGSYLSKYKNERLQSWIDDLYSILLKECNDDVNISFKGTLLDYEDMVETLEEADLSDFNVELSHVPSAESDEKIQELKELFATLEDGPFEDLKDQKIKNDFNKAIDSEFRVSVIATMSSGKSTLINALLGREFLPSKNEACTASITRIKDIDGMEGFQAQCRDGNKNIIVDKHEIDESMMKKYNEDENISLIDIEGDIPFINSSDAKLVLLDTPGPNNSRNENHRNHTYRIIKKNKPMVLYILDGTSLSTNDDNELLSAVAEKMKVGGKQSKDRFLFVINKMDSFDLEKGDCIETAINNVKAYLSKHGIENPNIYPASAEVAKIIRMKKFNQKLSKQQRVALNSTFLFTEEPKMHLYKYAPLKRRTLGEFNQLVYEYKEKDDELSETLIHTGIPAIESSINTYLKKYASTMKVKEAVDTFMRHIENERYHGNLISSINENEEKRERLKNQMRHVQKQLDDGKKAKEFKKNLEKISEDLPDINYLAGKVEQIFQVDKVTGQVTPIKAQYILDKLINKISNVQSNIITELESIIENEVTKTAQNLIKKYKSYIKELLNEGDLDVDEYNPVTADIFDSSIPDAETLIKRSTIEEEIVVGEKWVKNENKKWYKPWTWGKEKGWNKKIYQKQELVDIDEVYQKLGTYTTGEFYKTKEAAQIEFNSQIALIKKHFSDEFDKLQKVLAKKVKEFEVLSMDSEALKKDLETYNRKKEWLENFVKKLDEILDK